jgi:hypothetical protein
MVFKTFLDFRLERCKNGILNYPVVTTSRLIDICFILGRFFTRRVTSSPSGESITYGFLVLTPSENDPNIAVLVVEIFPRFFQL